MLAAKHSIPRPHHAPKSDAAIWGETPVPQVHALLPPDSCAGAATAAAAPASPTRMRGVAAMLANKAARHAAALARYAAAQEAARAAAEAACAEAAAKLADRLAGSNGEIEGRMALLHESRVMRLSEAEIRQIWEDVESRSPQRAAWLLQLEADAAAAEAARRSAVEAALCDLGAAVEEAAHVDPGQAQRLLEGEALTLVDALLADRWALRIEWCVANLRQVNTPPNTRGLL
jgi:hypothetical protein